MAKILTVYIEAENDEVDFESDLDHIKKLISQGYTSGIQPQWEISN